MSTNLGHLQFGYPKLWFEDISGFIDKQMTSSRTGSAVNENESMRIGRYGEALPVFLPNHLNLSTLLRPDLSYSDVRPLPTFESVVDSGITIEDESEIRALFCQKPEIPGLTLDAQGALKAIFGPNHSLSLVFIEDPYDAQGNLAVLQIRVDMEVEQGLKLLDKFNSSWWKINRYRAEDRMIVDIKFL